MTPLARRTLRVLRAAALAYATVATAAWLLSERLLFRPPPPSYAPGAVVRVPVAGPDSIAVRWLPNPAARHAILYSHGNAEDVGQLEPVLRGLHAAGFAVLAYDYRGYGRSTPRRPGEASAVADGLAAYRHLTGALGVPPERVLLHGRSLGGAVASQVAARCPAAGLVLESTFTSAYAVVLPPLLRPDRFRTAAALRRVPVPVLVMHGDADRTIPISHGRRLHAAALRPAPPLWVEGAGHDDLAFVAGERYFTALRAFAASLPAAASTPARAC